MRSPAAAPPSRPGFGSGGCAARGRIAALHGRWRRCTGHRQPHALLLGARPHRRQAPRPRRRCAWPQGVPVAAGDTSLQARSLRFPVVLSRSLRGARCGAARAPCTAAGCAPPRRSPSMPSRSAIEHRTERHALTRRSVEPIVEPVVEPVEPTGQADEPYELEKMRPNRPPSAFFVISPESHWMHLPLRP